MARMGKWIEGVSAEDRVADVARRTLEVRLSVVEHYLPLAAQHADETVENVHQLRVSSRRARAALQLYEEFLPEKKTRWISKQLSQIRRAAGEARDCDVLQERLSTAATPSSAKQDLDKILKRIRQHRRDAQPAIIEVFEKLTVGGKFHNRIDQLLQRVRPRRGKAMRKKFALFQRWAPRQLRPIVADFLYSSPNAKRSLDDLHRCRIRGKNLRYAMELLAPAFPEAFRDELYPFIEQIQSRLGNVMDHLAAQERYKDILKECTSSEQTKLIQKLVKSEAQLIKESKQDFFSWWTGDLEAELKGKFESFLSKDAG